MPKSYRVTVYERSLESVDLTVEVPDDATDYEIREAACKAAIESNKKRNFDGIEDRWGEIIGRPL